MGNSCHILSGCQINATHVTGAPYQDIDQNRPRVRVGDVHEALSAGLQARQLAGQRPRRWHCTKIEGSRRLLR